MKFGVSRDVDANISAGEGGGDCPFHAPAITAFVCYVIVGEVCSDECLQLLSTSRSVRLHTVMSETVMTLSPPPRIAESEGCSYASDWMMFSLRAPGFKHRYIEHRE